MSEPARQLLRAGAEAGMVEDFRALAEATAPNGLPRYRERPVLEDLARFLVRGGGGPNRDTAFYELCHLVNAVDAADNARDRRNAFFLGPEQATAARFRARLDAALHRGGWRRPGFTHDADGVTIHYLDGAFSIRFSRMPFLAALYEFLAGMEDFAFFPELQEILDEIGNAPRSVKAVQGASNRIASHFRQYRRRHLAAIRQEGRFDLILGFLMERASHRHVVVDDAAVLDFWSEKSAGGDFRAYRTVFDAFAAFLRAMDEAGRAEAVERAASIGIDRENGEVEPDDSSADMDVSDWVSPFLRLDEEPAAGIKFLKKESERRPAELLMHYGPIALRLPLAFLRLESFGPVQSAITTDLQIGRHDMIEARLACSDAPRYGEIVTRFTETLEILRRLQKAAFYVLHRNHHGHAAAPHVVPLRTQDDTRLFDEARNSLEEGRTLPEDAAIERLMAEAARTFRSISRKGFDEAELSDPARVEGFRIGALALISAATQLERYLAVSARLARREPDLDGWFDADRQAFSRRFGILYGARQ